MEDMRSNLEQKLRKEPVRKAPTKNKKPKDSRKKKEVNTSIDISGFLAKEESELLNDIKVDYQKLFDYLASYKKPELVTSHENPIKPAFSYEGELTPGAIESILRKQKMDKIMMTNTMSEIPFSQREKWSLLSKTSTYFAQSTAFYDIIT
jgi:hypothetical protein